MSGEAAKCRQCKGVPVVQPVGPMFRVSCKCGMQTALRPFKGDALRIWSGKKPLIVEVTYPGPRGAEPGTVNADLARDIKAGRVDTEPVSAKMDKTKPF